MKGYIVRATATMETEIWADSAEEARQKALDTDDWIDYSYESFEVEEIETDDES